MAIGIGITAAIAGVITVAGIVFLVILTLAICNAAGLADEASEDIERRLMRGELHLEGEEDY